MESPGYLDDLIVYIDDRTAGRIRKDKTAFSGGTLTFIVTMPSKFAGSAELEKQLAAEDELDRRERRARREAALAALVPQGLRRRLMDPTRLPRPRPQHPPEVVEGDAEEAELLQRLPTLRADRGPALSPSSAAARARRKPSGRLVIKSLIEQTKEVADSRLARLIARLLAPKPEQPADEVSARRRPCSTARAYSPSRTPRRVS